MTNTSAIISVALLLILAPVSGAVALGAPASVTATQVENADAPGTDDDPTSGFERMDPDRANPRNETNESRGPPKVEDGLLDDRLETEVVGPDRTTVVVEARPGGEDRAARIAGRLGTVEARHENRIQVTLPRTAIPALADTPAVAFVGAPIPVEPVQDLPVRPGEPSLSTPYLGTPSASMEPGTGVDPARTVDTTSVAGSVTSEGVSTTATVTPSPS